MLIEQYTPSQLYALGTILEGNNVFITGRPGTGKTALLNDIAEKLSAEKKKVLCTATTGLASSILPMGKTIHRALKWRIDFCLDDYELDHCCEELKDADYLIIDEVSTMNHDILQLLYACIEYLGAVAPKLILSGDFHQLPPVMNKYLYNRGIRYPFQYKEWDELNLIPCVLKEIVRQEDPTFRLMLELAMEADASCIPYFNRRVTDYGDPNSIYICTRTFQVKRKNMDAYRKLDGREYRYKIKGDVVDDDYNSREFNPVFLCKKGMRVMTTRNDSNQRFFNGSLGTVIDMGEDIITVKFDSGCVVDIERVDYPGAEGVVFQFPLELGYAITIHKSQGQTFDSLNIIANKCWDPGQLYVALSRARTIEGIHLLKPICASDLKVSRAVIDFYKNLEKSCNYAA